MVRRLSIHERRVIELEALMEPKPIPADTRITVLAWEAAPKGSRLAIKEAVEKDKAIRANTPLVVPQNGSLVFICVWNYPHVLRHLHALGPNFVFIPRHYGFNPPCIELTRALLEDVEGHGIYNLEWFPVKGSEHDLAGYRMWGFEGFSLVLHGLFERAGGSLFLEIHGYDKDAPVAPVAEG